MRKSDGYGGCPFTDLLYQCAGRECSPHGHAVLPQVLILRGCRFPRNVDVPFEIPHLIENLYSILVPVTHVDQTVVTKPQAMQHVFGVLFLFGAMEFPLTEKLSVLVDHCNSIVPVTMAVGDVNIAVLGINSDTGWTIELRSVGIQRLAPSGSIRGIEHT